MSDEKLLLLLQEKPEQGVQEMMKLYGGAVATICRNFLYDFTEDDIEEAVADTFISFWKNRERFALKANYSLKSYLYAIARNAARDKRRKSGKADIYSLEELSLELPDGYDLEQEVQRKEYEAVLHTCLERMGEPDKSVFLYPATGSRCGGNQSGEEKPLYRLRSGGDRRAEAGGNAGSLLHW